MLKFYEKLTGRDARHQDNGEEHIGTLMTVRDITKRHTNQLPVQIRT
jgi:hypothetical protein